MEEWKKMVSLSTSVIPKLKVKYKEDSWVWRLLPKATREATTTLRYTIWFPSREWAAHDAVTVLAVVLHEIKHAEDKMNHKVAFPLGYAMPQVLAFFGLCAGIVASVLFQWWWALVGLAALGAIAPWPSPWRLSWEYYGYSVSVWYWNFLFKAHPTHLPYGFWQEYEENLVKKFLGKLYYRMAWRKKVAEDTAFACVYTRIQAGRPCYLSSKLREYAVQVATEVGERWTEQH